MARAACPNRGAGCRCERCEEQRAYQRAWAKAHYDPEKSKARREPRVEVARRMREWRAANRERVRSTRRAWYAANRERCQSASRAYLERNPDYHYRWAATHPDSYARSRANLRATSWLTRAGREVRRIERESISRHSSEWRRQHDALFIQSGGLCYLCALPTVRGASDRGCRPSMDHRTPIARGGLHIAENLALAHVACNAAKAVKDFGGGVPEWFRALRRERMQPRIKSQQETSLEGRCS